MFDPWKASEVDVICEQDKWEKDGNPVASPLCPLFQVNAACRVVCLREEIDQGSGFAVLAAIRLCVTNGLVAPEWLAYAFNRRYDEVLNCRVGSWDDPLAFGRPYQKGANLAARRKAKLGQLVVWLSVVTRLKTSPETPIDKALFEEVGKPLGFGATLTEKYYYGQKALHRTLFGEDSDVVRLEPAPAKIRNVAGLRKKNR